MDLPHTPPPKKKWGKRMGYEIWSFGDNIEAKKVEGREERMDVIIFHSVLTCMKFSRLKKYVSKNLTLNFVREF